MFITQLSVWVETKPRTTDVVDLERQAIAGGKLVSSGEQPHSIQMEVHPPQILSQNVPQFFTGPQIRREVGQHDGPQVVTWIVESKKTASRWVIYVPFQTHRQMLFTFVS